MTTGRESSLVTSLTAAQIRSRSMPGTVKNPRGTSSKRPLGAMGCASTGSLPLGDLNSEVPDYVACLATR
jgi:hypothetical protein